MIGEASSWRPTIEQVAAVMPNRFRGGAPSETSRPNVNQIEQYIDMVTRQVRAAVLAEPGYALPDPLNLAAAAQQRALARDAVIMGTAAWIENGLAPEQNDDLTGGTAEFYRRRHQEAVAALSRDMLIVPIG